MKLLLDCVVTYCRNIDKTILALFPVLSSGPASLMTMDSVSSTSSLSVRDAALPRLASESPATAVLPGFDIALIPWQILRSVSGSVWIRAKKSCFTRPKKRMLMAQQMVAMPSRSERTELTMMMLDGADSRKAMNEQATIEHAAHLAPRFYRRC